MIQELLAGFLKMFSRENIARILIATLAVSIYTSFISSIEKKIRKAPILIRLVSMMFVIIGGFCGLVVVLSVMFKFLGI